MALPNGPTVLPFKSDKISFCLDYKSDAAPAAAVELSCVCFGRDAQVLDYVQFNRRAALNSALKHSACSYLPPKDAVPGADEAIHMYPFELSAQCEVLLLLASAPASALQCSDLAASGRLQFTVLARELGAQAAQVLDVDLAALLAAPAKQRAAGGDASPAAGTNPALSNGHQTMVVAAVYTTPGGWTLSFDCSTFGEDHWGLLLPQLRRLLQRWPALSAASAAAAAGPRLREQVVVCSRRNTDAALSDLAARLAAREAAAAAAAAAAGGGGVSAVSVDTSSAAEGEQPGAPDDTADGGEAVPADGTHKDDAAAPPAQPVAAPAAAPAAAAAAAPAASVPSTDRLVLELGWDVYRPLLAAADDDAAEQEDEEPPLVDFAIGVYNLQGEELVTLNADNPAFDGVAIEDEVQEDEEGAAAEQAAGALGEGGGAQAAAAGGAGAETRAGAAAAGEGDDDDGFVKEDDAGGEGKGGQLAAESSEARAARIAAAAEAAAAAAQAAAANQRPLAERFPLKRRVQLSLPELPPDARALLLTMTSFGGRGFKNVKTLQARLLLAPPGAPTAADGAADDAEAAAARARAKTRQPERVLLHYRFDSVQGADGHLSQLLVAKLYREYGDSAFALWSQQQVPDVAALLGGAAAVEAAAAAAAAVAACPHAGEAVSTERAKEVLQQVLAARKQLAADLAARRAKAAEEGLELEEDEDEEGRGGPDLRLQRGVWRARVLGVPAGGDSPEDATALVANLLAYDGGLDAAGVRSCPAAKVAFPNRDTYFGPYAAAGGGVKAGTGLYVGANGAAYVGQYAGGLRAGFGVMALPDGGMYRGGFRADKFEGQGTYLYPDSSLYTGSWRGGRKHGPGTYWDAAGGCLRGEWAHGQLRGTAQYDQPSYHFEGRFAKGLPAGPCSFQLSSGFRTAGLPAAAASHITAPHGPTLRGEGAYALPPGAELAAGEEPADADAAEAEAGGEDSGGGDEASVLPAWPKYEGLAYQSAVRPPCSVADVPFPPPPAPMAAI